MKNEEIEFTHENICLSSYHRSRFSNKKEKKRKEKGKKKNDPRYRHSNFFEFYERLNGRAYPFTCFIYSRDMGIQNVVYIDVYIHIYTHT